MPVKQEPVIEDPVLAGRMRNLAKANDTRFRKAQLKRDLAAMTQAEATAFLADRLDSNSQKIDAFTMEELLLAIPGVGKTKAKRFSKAVEVRLAVKWKMPPREPLPLSVRVRDLCESRRKAWSFVLQERFRHLEREASHEHLA